MLAMPPQQHWAGVQKKGPLTGLEDIARPPATLPPHIPTHPQTHHSSNHPTYALLTCVGSMNLALRTAVAVPTMSSVNFSLFTRVTIRSLVARISSVRVIITILAICRDASRAVVVPKIHDAQMLRQSKNA